MMKYTEDPVLTDKEDYVMRLLVNGWVANRTVANEFRINNGEPQNMSIIDRLLTLGLVMQSSARAYVATVCPLPGQSIWMDH